MLRLVDYFTQGFTSMIFDFFDKLGLPPQIPAVILILLILFLISAIPKWKHSAEEEGAVYSRHTIRRCWVSITFIALSVELQSMAVGLADEPNFVIPQWIVPAGIVAGVVLYLFNIIFTIKENGAHAFTGLVYYTCTGVIKGSIAGVFLMYLILCVCNPAYILTILGAIAMVLFSGASVLAVIFFIYCFFSSFNFVIIFYRR